MSLVRAAVNLAGELPKALWTELVGEPFEYESRTTLDDGGARPNPRTSPWSGENVEPPAARYRFIREVGNKVSQGGLGLGGEVTALEVRVPVTLVADSTMPEETRAAIQLAMGELYDQARRTLRTREPQRGS